ncbi:MAG: hypothetical protein HOW73_25635 [Polyangiaceae bacterium]|nr:hypothetical protein [Polyangiaceae bacterium]
MFETLEPLPRRLHLALFGLLVAAMSAHLAIYGVQGAIPSPTLLQRVLVWLGMCLGPLNGWRTFGATGHIVEALWLLVPTTAFGFGALVVTLLDRTEVTLFIGAGIWVVLGFFYAVPNWIL